MKNTKIQIITKSRGYHLIKEPIDFRLLVDWSGGWASVADGFRLSLQSKASWGISVTDETLQ